MVLMCVVPDIICSTSVNRTGVLLCIACMVFLRCCPNWRNNCLFGLALFLFIYFDLCKLIPIGKLLPFWVVGPLMCVVVCNHPNQATLSPLGRKLN